MDHFKAKLSIDSFYFKQSNMLRRKKDVHTRMSFPAGIFLSYFYTQWYGKCGSPKPFLPNYGNGMVSFLCLEVYSMQITPIYFTFNKVSVIRKEESHWGFFLKPHWGRLFIDSKKGFKRFIMI